MRGRQIAACEYAEEGDDIYVDWYKRPLTVTRVRETDNGRELTIEQQSKTYDVIYNREKESVTMTLKRNGKEVSPDISYDLWLDDEDVPTKDFDLDLPAGVSTEDLHDVAERLYWENVYNGDSFEYTELRDYFIALLIAIEESPKGKLRWKYHPDHEDVYSCLETAASWMEAIDSFHIDEDLKDKMGGWFYDMYKKVDGAVFNADYTVIVTNLPKRIIADSPDDAIEQASEFLGEEACGEVVGVETESYRENWRTSDKASQRERTLD